ncbi:MAG: phytoene/squalene synthase family protein [Reyranellaceae bacterium]
MQAPSPDLPLARRDLAACRTALRHGSRTFLTASWLLPAAVRDAACALYAFCRDADDAIDLGRDPRRAHDRLLQRLERLYAGRPEDSPVDRAFARVAERYAISRALPEALIEGFAWDATGRCYETESDLLAYASRVAGSVGVMMALLMERRAAPVLARAAELGMAMQLTNVARDVGEDARAGRLYLPRQWLREAGIDSEAWLARPVFTPPIGAVVARLLAAADALYGRAERGIAVLPAGCRPGIRAARTLYAAIGDEIARRGHDSVSGRAVVPAMAKLALIGRTLLAPPPAIGLFEPGTLPEARHLIDAAVAAVPTPAVPGDGRIVWLLALFDRLERRELARPGLTAP